MDFRWWCVLDSISRKQEQICLFVVKKFLIYFQKNNPFNILFSRKKSIIVSMQSTTLVSNVG